MQAAAPASKLPLTSAFIALALLAGCGGRAAHGGDRANEMGGAGGNVGGGANSDGASASAGASAAAGASGEAGEAGASEAGGARDEACAPGRAPLRRLTRAEYVKTLASLFGDAGPASISFPLDTPPFPVGNLAEGQAVGLEGARGFFEVAKDVAKRATSDSKALASLATCAGGANPDAACARTTIASFAAKAFRRAPTDAEVNELLALHASILDKGGNFAAATRAVIAAILQTPEFLYRIEWGTDDGPRPDVRRLSGDEMATRLSYLFWGTSPDDALRAAAQSGDLLEAEGVAKQARRLLNDPRSRAGMATFFADFLELDALPQLQRSDPAYSSSVGAALQEATQRFLESQIFDHDASWPGILTSNKAFVTGPVSNLYGVSGVTGEAWQEVSLDPTQRLGLLTQPSWLMAGVRSDRTNPVQRGYRMMEKILCRDVAPETPEISAQAPGFPSGDLTNRERYAQFTSPAICASCHGDMNQLGFAFEAFDSLGRYRTMDNGAPIDTKVNVTGIGPTNDAIELVKQLAVLPEAQSCFARRVAEFSLGKALASDPAGDCLKRDIARRFEASGYNVRQLLLDLTQTDAFLYLPKDR